MPPCTSNLRECERQRCFPSCADMYNFINSFSVAVLEACLPILLHSSQCTYSTYIHGSLDDKCELDVSRLVPCLSRAFENYPGSTGGGLVLHDIAWYSIQHISHGVQFPSLPLSSQSWGSFSQSWSFPNMESRSIQSQVKANTMACPLCTSSKI